MKTPPETETLSTEQPKNHADRSEWQTFALLVLYFIISEVLQKWLTKPLALAIAAAAVLLIGYRFTHRNIGFPKWALGSLLLVFGYGGFIYGIFYALHHFIGTVLTAGILVFVVVASFRFVQIFFLGEKPKEGIGKWLMISSAAGLIGAFLGYINPDGWKPY